MNKSPFFPIAGKVPKIKWKEERTPLSELNKHESLGFVPPEGFVVIDADTPEAVLNVEKVNDILNINPISYPTSRGKHFIYRKPRGEYFEGLVSQVDVSLFVDPNKKYRGSKIDLKGSSKDKVGYVKVKDKGKWRIPLDKLLEAYKREDTPVLPYVLAITPKFKFSLEEYKNAGRHMYVFNKVPFFRIKKWEKDQFIRFCVELKLLAGDEETISQTEEWAVSIWESSIEMGPVEEYKPEKLTLDDIIENESEHRKFIAWQKKGNLELGTDAINIEALAKLIIKDTNLQFSIEDDQIWGVENGEFVPILKFDLFLKRWLIKKYGNIKPTVFYTIKGYIDGAIPVKTFYKNKFAVKFRNKIIDISTGNEIIVPDGQILNNLIPHNLISKEELETTHKEAKEFLDKTMLSWTKNRKILVKQIYERIGLSMSKHSEDKAYFLLGTGSNGKSVFLELLIRLFGVSNISNEDLKDLSEDQFSLANLYSKLININPDISADVIQDTALFKKIVSGDYVASSYKGKDKFTFKPYATLWFGANNIPHPRERGDSDAINRRIEIIPFNNKYDEHGISQKEKNKFRKRIEDPKVVEVLAYYSMEAVKKALQNGFTISNASKKILEEFIKDVNHIYNFVEQRTHKPDEVKITVYKEYKKWVENYGYKPLGFTEFSKKYINALRYFGIIVETEHRKEIKGDQAYRFIKVGEK